MSHLTSTQLVRKLSLKLTSISISRVNKKKSLGYDYFRGNHDFGFLKCYMKARSRFESCIPPAKMKLQDVVMMIASKLHKVLCEKSSKSWIGEQ